VTAFEIHVPLRWADIDGYQHVNNAAMLTILEEARIAAFWASDADDADEVADDATPPRTALLDAGPGARTLTLIARQEVEYLLPIEYTRVPLTIRMWISHIGGASLDVCYEVVLGGRVHALALTSIVLVDAASGRPRRVTTEERSVWERHVAPPVEFRHRR
jgi:acyl-CoA thioester hydrolase